jgi:hypothetical protein
MTQLLRQCIKPNVTTEKRKIMYCEHPKSNNLIYTFSTATSELSLYNRSAMQIEDPKTFSIAIHDDSQS